MVEGDGNAAQLVVALNLQTHGQIALAGGQGFDRLSQQVELGQDVGDDGQGDAEADQNRDDGQARAMRLGIFGVLLNGRFARLDHALSDP